jgi:hypothetical protein
MRPPLLIQASDHHPSGIRSPSLPFLLLQQSREDDRARILDELAE